MSTEVLQKQKQGYETQLQQTEQRLQALAQETEQRTVQREQLRGAIFALQTVMTAMAAPAPEKKEEEKKALEVVKDETPAGDAPAQETVN